VQVAKGRRTWLERYFKQHTWSLKQASSKSGGGGSFVVPGLTAESKQTLLRPLYGDALDATNDQFGLSAYYRVRLFLVRGLIPAALIGFGAWFSENWQAVALAGIWLAVAFWWTRRYFRTFEVAINDEVMHIRRGVFTRRHELFSHFKVQAVTMRQSPYQRRHTLATLTLHTAGGDLRVPFLPLARAEALRDYFLYKTETDQRDWM
jgi:putative membrane protein